MVQVPRHSCAVALSPGQGVGRSSLSTFPFQPASIPFRTRLSFLSLPHREPDRVEAGIDPSDFPIEPVA